MTPAHGPAEGRGGGASLSQRAVSAVDTWRLKEAEADARALGLLLWSLRGSPMGKTPSAMGAVILFKESSAGLDARARTSLGDRCAMLRANPGSRVVIGGFAGHPLGSAYGMRLALRRVQAIRAFLRSEGVEPDRIEVAIRSAEWSLIERSDRWIGEDPSGECRLQVGDPHWALSRN